MLKRFVGLNLCQTQNWSERPWRSSCHTPLGPSTDTAGTTVNTNARTIADDTKTLLSWETDKA